MGDSVVIVLNHFGLVYDCSMEECFSCICFFWGRGESAWVSGIWLFGLDCNFKVDGAKGFAFLNGNL